MLAKADVYGTPPLARDRTQHLDSNYVDTAEVDVRLQLGRAGIRLAHMLNTSLGTEPDDWSACLLTCPSVIPASGLKTRLEWHIASD